MVKRSECTCICHNDGVVALHCIPCCFPDPVEPIEEIINKNIDNIVDECEPIGDLLSRIEDVLK